MGLIRYESHELLTYTYCLRRVIGYPEQHKHVCKAHYAQTDLPVGLCPFLDLWNWIVVDVDYIVKKPDSKMDDPFEPLEINLIVPHKTSNVDGTQIARFIRQKGLFSTRIGGFDLAHEWRRVSSVNR